MSETKDPRRTRRRASRTAGPPVEDATEQLTTGSAASGAAADESADIAAEKSEDVTERIDTSAASAPDAASVAGSGDTDETVRIDKSTAETVVLGKTGTKAGSAGKSGSGDKKAGASAGSMDKSAAESAAAESAAAESDGPESDGPEPAAQGGSRSWKRIVALAAAAVLAIGLVGAAVLSMLAVQSTEQRDERRAEYVATARQTVLNLTTIRADTAKEDIDRILTMASGEFKTEFDGRIDPFTEIVKQAKVQSTGEVVEAAVERDDENSAVILVAAKQTLTNAGAEGEQQRYYRFRVTVQRGDDGGLTASDVEFVA